MADHVTPLRTEQIYKVKQAKSLKNNFANVSLPQNPNLAYNNWSGSHQDSYCSESVGLKGPVSDNLRVIIKQNPYGFTPIMACNEKNQMIGMAFTDGFFHLITFDTDCNIITANKTGQAFHDVTSGSFAGGYFFLDNDGNSIAVGDNKLQAYPTASITPETEVYALEPLWTTTSVVDAVTNGDDNILYSAMPVWGAEPGTYWCLFGGKYTVSNGDEVKISKYAYIAVVQVKTSTKRAPKDNAEIEPIVLAYLRLDDQYVNNTFAVTEQGAVFVTNGLDTETGRCTSGYCYLVSHAVALGAIDVKWKSPYDNSGYLKPGQKNVGSGTTPTVMVHDSGRQLVAITDNAYPKMHVVVYDVITGDMVIEKEVFMKMRGSNEASVIGIQNSIFVPNNFGHTVSATQSQYVSNEPGFAKLEVSTDTQTSNIVWSQKAYTNFAMSMLARKSGIIFAHSGEWYDEASAVEGPVYYILAIDSFDGRVIWRIPIGRGRPYCHEYGGIYFDRDGDKIFMGTNNFLVSIQDYTETSVEDK